MPEQASDNANVSRAENGELHPGDAVEEKISLSERFGIWVTFYGFTQDAYLAVVDSRLGEAGFDTEQIRAAREPALQWALERGARSGRIAVQFVRDYIGRMAEESDAEKAPARCERADAARRSVDFPVRLPVCAIVPWAGNIVVSARPVLAAGPKRVSQPPPSALHSVTRCIAASASLVSCWPCASNNCRWALSTSR